MGPAGFCGAGLVLQTMASLSELRLNRKIYAAGQLVGRAHQPPHPGSCELPARMRCAPARSVLLHLPPRPPCTPVSARGVRVAPCTPWAHAPGPRSAEHPEHPCMLMVHSPRACRTGSNIVEAHGAGGLWWVRERRVLG